MIDFVGEFQGHATDKAVLGGLIGLGLFQCFFGVRFFRQSLAIAAFCSTFLVTTAIASHHLDKDEYAYAVGASAGVIAALIAGCFVKFGMLLLGTCAGLASSYVAYLTILHYTSVHNGDVVFYVSTSLAGVVGALIGMHLSRWIVIMATAIGGALVTTRSVDLLWDNILTKDAVRSGHLPREGWELVAGFGVLAVFGVVFQAVGGHDIQGSKKKQEQDHLLRLPTYTSYTSSSAPAPQYQ